jgi:hypothetical protein
MKVRKSAAPPLRPYVEGRPTLPFAGRGEHVGIVRVSSSSVNPVFAEADTLCGGLGGSLAKMERMYNSTLACKWPPSLGSKKAWVDQAYCPVLPHCRGDRLAAL